MIWGTGKLDHLVTTSLAASSAASWNGPRCLTCGRGYIGTHTCSVDDLRSIVADLNRRIDALEQAARTA